MKPFIKYPGGKIKEFTRTIVILILLIVILTILVEVVCFFIGIPILNLIYGVNLNEYKIDLLILVLSGCFYAISILMLSVSTTIRKQKVTTYIYIISSIVALIVPKMLIKGMGMRGASISNVIITIALAVLLSLVYIKEAYTKRKEVKTIGKN